MSRLYKKFKEEIVPELKTRHPDRNVMSLPVLKKIVISMGLGEALKDKNALQEHSDELAMLSVKSQLLPVRRKRFRTSNCEKISQLG